MELQLIERIKNLKNKQPPKVVPPLPFIKFSTHLEFQSIGTKLLILAPLFIIIWFYILNTLTYWSVNTKLILLCEVLITTCIFVYVLFFHLKYIVHKMGRRLNPN